jgi:RNA polymerase sigma-70 factor (ECF subfamily)
MRRVAKKRAKSTRGTPPETSTRDLKGLSDEDLMRHCQEGDSDTFDELFSRYEGSTLALLNRLVGDRTTAEALAQEAFLRIYRDAESYEYPRRFSTWFFTIVRNLAKNELRYRQRHPAHSLEDGGGDGGESDRPALIDEVKAPTRTPLSSIVSKEILDRVHEAIADLPEAEREALILHRFSNLKYREIADIVGTRLGTVRSRLHSALNRLRRSLSDLEERFIGGRSGGAADDDSSQEDER